MITLKKVPATDLEGFHPLRWYPDQQPERVKAAASDEYFVLRIGISSPWLESPLILKEN
jgi:hypothetical protein